MLKASFSCPHKELVDLFTVLALEDVLCRRPVRGVPWPHRSVLREVSAGALFLLLPLHTIHFGRGGLPG